MEPQQSYYTAHTDFEYPEDEQEQENEFRERALEMIRITSSTAAPPMLPRLA